MASCASSFISVLSKTLALLHNWSQMLFDKSLIRSDTVLAERHITEQTLLFWTNNIRNL